MHVLQRYKNAQNRDFSIFDPRFGALFKFDPALENSDLYVSKVLLTFSMAGFTNHPQIRLPKFLKCGWTGGKGI